MEKLLEGIEKLYGVEKLLAGIEKLYGAHGEPWHSYLVEWCGHYSTKTLSSV